MCAIYKGFRCVRPCTSIFHMWYIIVRFSPQNRGFGGDFAKIVWRFADTFCCRTTQKIWPFKVASKTAQSVSPTAFLFLNLMDVSNHMFSSHPHFILDFFHFFFEHQWTFHERHSHANRVGQLWRKNHGNQTSHCNFLGMGVGGGGGLQIVNVFIVQPCVGKPKTLFSRHSKNSFRPLSALSSQMTAQMPCQIGHILKAPTYRRHLRQNPGECGGPSPALWWMSGRFSWIWRWRFAKVRQSSPNFARLRQSSHEGARVLLVHHGTCLIKGKVYPEKISAPASAETRWRKTAWRVDALPP